MTNEQYRETLELVDGMRLTLDGVAGIVRVEKRNGMTEFVHHPSAAGKKSARYIETRRRLGDDYVTDITSNDEAMLAVFAKAEKLLTAEVS